MEILKHLFILKIIVLLLVLKTIATDYYTLEESHIGICTVHLKYLYKTPWSVSTYEEVILSNIDKVIWTLWSSNDYDKEIVIPIIQFFELCTINIIVDESVRQRDFKRLSYYTSETQFSSRSWTHNAFIVIRKKCDNTLHHYHNTLPHRLFLHLNDFKKCPWLSRRFPNNYFIPNPGKQLFDMRPTLSIHKRIPRKEYEQDVFFLPLKYDYKHKMVHECFIREYKCLFTMFIIKHLETVVNFTAVSKIPKENSRGLIFGTVYLNTWQKNLEIDQMNGVSEIYEAEFKVMYCDFTTKKDKIAFSAWWSPFTLLVWIVFGSILFVISITIGFYKDYKFDFKLFKHLYTTIRVVLRQDEDSRICLILLFTFLVLIITSLYENTITGELIAPSPPVILTDLVDLIDSGYKLIYSSKKGKDLGHLRNYYSFHNSNKIKWFRRHFARRNATDRMKFEDFLVKYDNPFLDYSQDPDKMFGNPDYKLAKSKHDRRSNMYNTLARLQVDVEDYPCFFIKESIYESLGFALFENSQQEWIYRALGIFKQAGLIPLWDSLREFKKSLKWKRKLAIRSTGLDLIISTNLVPIFAVWGAFLCTSFIVFVGYELRVGHKILWRDLIKIFILGFNFIRKKIIHKNKDKPKVVFIKVQQPD